MVEVKTDWYSFCSEKDLHIEDKVRRNKVMEMEVGRADHNELIQLTSIGERG